MMYGFESHLGHKTLIIMSKAGDLERLKALEIKLSNIEKQKGKNSKEYKNLKSQIDFLKRKMPKYHPHYLKKYGL